MLGDIVVDGREEGILEGDIEALGYRLTVRDGLKDGNPLGCRLGSVHAAIYTLSMPPASSVTKFDVN